MPTGSAPAADILEVEISNDGGESWTNLETVGPGGREVSGGWIFKSFRLEDLIQRTSQMQIRFIAADLGDGSIVEAGIDRVKLTLMNCARQVRPRSFALENGNIRRGGPKPLFAGNPSGVLCLTTDDPSVPMIASVSTNLPVNPGLLYFTAVSQAGMTNEPMIITLELLNHDTQEYETLASQTVNTGTQVILSGVATGDLARFIDGRRLNSRIIYQRTDDLDRPINIRIKEAYWSFTD